MRKLIIVLFVFIIGVCFSQRADTLVNVGIYKSLYSFKKGQPTYVIYKLYKGGGNCDRSNFDFKKDTIINNLTADGDDFKNTGYDRGHLCNAEDFAFDCKKQEKTFRYYNCCPQTVKLNRGVWKKNENDIREMSQRDSLIVICGGIFLKSAKPIKEGSKLLVPKYYYKVVVSLTTKKVIQSALFTNDDEAKVKEISIEELQGKTKFFFDRVLSINLKQ